MSDARQRILASIRRGAGHESASKADIDTIHAEQVRVQQSPRLLWSGTTLARFTEKLREAGATSTRADNLSAVPAALSNYAASRDFPDSLRLDVAPHPELAELALPDSWDIQTGKPRPNADMGLSRATAGIAESGTLVMSSSPASPATLNFLPEHHIVVLHVMELLDYLEDAWGLLRNQTDFPPRAINLITGPSRTADIEQTLQLGAHGPRQLHIVLIEGKDQS